MGSGPASLGSRSLGRLPSSRDHTPSVPKAGRGDRQGAEQRQWHPLARQGRQVLGRRHPGPSPKRPVKLEAISEPQVPRGLRGTQDRPPASLARRRVEDGELSPPEVSFGARRPGMTRGGVVGALTGQRGARPGNLSLFPSLPPQRTPLTLTAAAGRGRGGAWLAAETEAPAAAEGKPPSPCC